MPDNHNVANVALYRLWRSKRFADQIGQEAITTALRVQARDKSFTHAYLFSGPRGTGKTSTAKIFARAINCTGTEDGEPCGHCASCEALSREDAIDLIEVDAASKSRVEEMRDLLDHVMYLPAVTARRVYIIDEVHMLSRHAFNALLKTLEEPPSHVVFILATTEPNRLPDTILSRCQWYAFHRIEPRLIQERLSVVADKHQIGVTPGALWLIARASEGGMRDALSLLDVCRSTNAGRINEESVRLMLGAADPATLFDLADACGGKDAGRALALLNDAFLAGMEPAALASSMAGHIRSLLTSQLTSGKDLEKLPETLGTTAEAAERYREQAMRFRMDNLLRLLDLFSEAGQTKPWQADPRLTLEMAALRACVPDDVVVVAEMAARIDALERMVERLAHGVPAAAPSIDISRASVTSADQTDDAVPPITNPTKAYNASANPTASRTATPRTSPSSAADDRKLWAKATDILARSKPSLMARMRQGSFAGRDGDAVHLAFTLDGSLHADYFRNSTDNIAAVEDALEQAFGKRLRLIVDSASAGIQQSPAPPTTERDVIAHAIEMFGRDMVEVVADDAGF